MKHNQIMPHPSNRQTSGYCAVRLWSGDTQTIDYSTLADTPANCEVLATDSQYDPMLATKNRLAPIIGYVAVSIEITGRIEK